MTADGVVLVGLGGTIAMRETSSGAQPFHGAQVLADRVGGFAGAEDLALVGGSEVDFDLLERLVARGDQLIADGASGIVVTTGTDSIEEVSAWLAYRRTWAVPIVVTGAMVTGARVDSDGAANLADALVVASSGASVDPVVVFGGKVFAPREVLKISGVARDAFDAPGRGALATVGNGEIQWVRRPPRRRAHAARLVEAVRPVPIVTAALGDDGVGLLAAAENRRAVVVAANGAGNLPPGQAAAATRLAEEGILVVVTTRAPDARVAARYGYPGGGAGLAGAGAQLAPGLSAHRARLLVALGVAQGLHADGLRALIASETERADAAPQPAPAVTGE